jgi:uncharacterized lipoprotein YmbA
MNNTCVAATVLGFCLVVMAGGCVSFSPSPTPRYYALHRAPADRNETASNTIYTEIVGVGAVKIPEYLQRPQLVTQSNDGMMRFAQFDRWGESIDAGIARMIGEELSTMLPAGTFVLYPWSSTLAVKYRIAIEVVRLECDLTKDMNLLVQWSVTDQQDLKTCVIRRTELVEPIVSHDHAGLVSALSTACVKLGREISAELIDRKA